MGLCVHGLLQNTLSTGIHHALRSIRNCREWWYLSCRWTLLLLLLYDGVHARRPGKGRGTRAPSFTARILLLMLLLLLLKQGKWLLQ